MNIQIYQCYKKLTIITPLEPYRYPLKPHDYLLQQGIHPHLSYPFPYPFHGNPHQWWRPQVEVNLKKSWRIMEIMSSGKSLQKEKISRRKKNWNCCSNCFWLIYNFTIVIIVKTLLKFYNSSIAFSCRNSATQWRSV